MGVSGQSGGDSAATDEDLCACRPTKAVPVSSVHGLSGILDVSAFSHDTVSCFRFRDDANTLFRSQSIVSKTMYEMMKFVGHDYLGCSMKPLIDLIYAKRECCEVDPSRLKEGDVLETNQV